MLPSGRYEVEIPRWVFWRSVRWLWWLLGIRWRWIDSTTVEKE